MGMQVSHSRHISEIHARTTHQTVTMAESQDYARTKAVFAYATQPCSCYAGPDGPKKAHIFARSCPHRVSGGLGDRSGSVMLRSRNMSKEGKRSGIVCSRQR